MYQQKPSSLNPFEVREVLQVGLSSDNANAFSLNPFEVREVLQVTTGLTFNTGYQSQSL